MGPYNILVLYNLTETLVFRKSSASTLMLEYVWIYQQLNSLNSIELHNRLEIM